MTWTYMVESSSHHASSLMEGWSPVAVISEDSTPPHAAKASGDSRTRGSKYFFKGDRAFCIGGFVLFTGRGHFRGSSHQNSSRYNPPTKIGFLPRKGSGSHFRHARSRICMRGMCHHQRMEHLRDRFPMPIQASHKTLRSPSVAALRY